MENIAEALKIAFAGLMLVLSLSLSMSSFSNARRAVDAVISSRDRDEQYVYLKDAEERYPGYTQDVYIEPTTDLSRIVGIETVVSTIYRAFKEDIVVYFFEDDLNHPLYISYRTSNTGSPGDPNRKVEFTKNEHQQKFEINYVDQNQGYRNAQDEKAFLDILVGGVTSNEEYEDEIIDTYDDVILNSEGLYKKFKNAKFEEILGQYEQDEGASQVTRRIVTYILKTS